MSLVWSDHATILFSAWTTSSWWQMLVACVGCAAAGVLFEGVSFARCRLVRWERRRRAPAAAAASVAAAALAYSCQLALSYALMLVVMTFNVPLILAVLLGHLVGNALLREGREGAGPPCHVDVVSERTPLLPAANSFGAGDTAPAAASVNAASAHVTLRIMGMDCASCVGTLEHALLAVPGVRAASVDFESGIGRVEFDQPDQARASVGQLINAVVDVGFNSELARPV